MSFPDVTALVPHRGAALLIDRVEEWSEAAIACSAEIREGHPYQRGAVVPAVVGLELMAQAVAAYVGLIRRAQGGAPRVGYLIGARRVDFHVAAHGMGDVLRVVATPTWLDGRAGSFECHIDRDGVRVSDATLSVFEAGVEELPP